MRAGNWLVKVAVVALCLGLLALGAPQSRRWLVRKTKGMLAWPIRHERAKLRRTEFPLAGLAASQVGYGPEMEKRFTSPRSLEGYQVRREADQKPICESSGPLERLPAGDREIGSVWAGDFSAVTAPGRYFLAAGELTSHPFAIGSGVYDAAVRAVQRSFYFQRAFTAVQARYAEGPWVHEEDSDRAPPGVRAGWHDAGDFSIYSASQNSALFWLLQTWRDFHPMYDDTNIPESGNGIPDLLDEARWGLEWLLSVQEREGGFRNSTCQEHYGPYGRNTPSNVPPYRNGEVGTVATARAVGTLASASTIWRRFDRRFSDRLLAAARLGQDYLDRHPETSDGPTCSAYRADRDLKIGRQTRMFAAAGMLLATGERRFADDFEANLVPVEGDPSYMNVNGFAARLYLAAAAGDPSRKSRLREAMGAQAARARMAGAQNPFQRSAPTFWGSIAAGFIRTGTFNVPACLDDPLGAAADCAQALDNVHYALGRNYLHLCYVSGLAGVAHARTRAFHHWLATLRAEPFLFPGLVAGGPNDSPEAKDTSNPLARPIPIWGYWGDPAFPRDPSTPYEARYTDNDSWSTNEVSLDWQASTLYSLYFAQWVARNPHALDPRPVEARAPDGKLPRCDRRQRHD
jgi:endoglucanase